MNREKKIISDFWNGREGIIPWGCVFDEIKQIIYPIIYTTKHTHQIQQNRTFIQVEDLAQNVIIHIAESDGLGYLIDRYGNKFPSNPDSDPRKVKRFVIIRNQMTPHPVIFILVKVSNSFKLYGGLIQNLNNPFHNIHEATQINNERSFYDIARYGNRLLLLELHTNTQQTLDISTFLWWSRENINYSALPSLKFHPTTPGGESLTFPEYFIRLPPSTFHFVWENYMCCSDGVYYISSTEIAGSFSLIYEKIFSLSIPNEFGGGTGLEDIRAGFQVFKGGFAVSLRGTTYVFQGTKMTELRQTNTDSIIHPYAPLVLRKLGFKHSVSPFIALPSGIRFSMQDNYFIALYQQGNQNILEIYEKGIEGKRIRGTCYIVSDFNSENMKYVKRIAPLRFYDYFIWTDPDEAVFIPPAPFLNTEFFTQGEYNVLNDWVQLREAGKTFIFEIDPTQSFQSVFEVEYDEGR